ncbi:hypothetical protein MP638_000811 [Amoeboaphelidium occidentale]|nr:hypothetical protein MP638_000811 [Amoeboaphelidium occidentale]
MIRSRSNGFRYHLEDLPVTQHEAASRANMAKDVGGLVYKYAERETADYSAFKEIWDEMRFALLHFGCVDINNRRSFMAEIYAHFIKYLVAGENVHVKIAALYGLYAMYKTQPRRLGVYDIEGMPAVWEAVSALCSYASERDPVQEDLIYVCWDMICQSKCLSFVAYEPRSNELYYFMKEFDAKGRFPTKYDEFAVPLMKYFEKGLDSVEMKLKMFSGDKELLESVDEAAEFGTDEFKERICNYETAIKDLGILPDRSMANTETHTKLSELIAESINSYKTILEETHEKLRHIEVVPDLDSFWNDIPTPPESSNGILHEDSFLNDQDLDVLHGNLSDIFNNLSEDDIWASENEIGMTLW